MADGQSEIQVWRIFSREDGTSSMERIESVPGLPPGATSLPWPAQRVLFQRLSKDLQPSWHTAPRRQVMATLIGEGELETGDGQVLILRPGVVTYLEDLTGQGHLTRPRGGADRLAIVVPLADTP